MGQTLRVMSANLWWGKANAEGLLALIRLYDIDAICCQELGFEQAEAISEELAFGELSPSKGPKGTGIALRRPATIEVVPMTYRPLHVARLDPADWPELGAPVEIATTHLAAPHIPPYGIGPFTRRRQTRQIESYLVENPVAHRLLVGDFNATPLWPAYRRIASQLTDAAVAVAQVEGRPVSATWGPGSGARRVLRIDHAFVSGLTPLAFEVVELAGSDHAAIVIDFSL
ncbi:MAG: endonuclease/exonuclease/phosphatase family protein [Myxococcota bacterium]|nr:endonuclease/exonuclease/phosphatase family protein [Myxococcota bacterium]